MEMKKELTEHASWYRSHIPPYIYLDDESAFEDLIKTSCKITRTQNLNPYHFEELRVVAREAVPAEVCNPHTN